MQAQLLALLLTTLASATYVLHSHFTGPTFLDNFDFDSSWDPTFGYVHYVDRATAQQYGMVDISAAGGPTVFGAEHTQLLDPDANLGRLSLRLTTTQSWTHGLFIVDIAHMPGTACGLWPAFWSLGVGDQPWPAEGEVDIIEYPNLAADNLMALHTKEGCNVAGSDMSGKILTNDCGKDLGVAGCYSSPTKQNSAGTDFNANGGGIYAMEWTSAAIKIWFFPRHQIPAGLHGPTPPDPTTFGIPDANFAGGCDIDEYFSNHSLIFDIDFCGSWAGPTFVNDGCPALDPTNQWRSCNMYAATNPQAYTEAYWAVNYLKVFTSTPGSPSPTSSFLSSVTPAASSTSVTDSGALGAPTTPTQSLWPPTSISTWSTSTPSSSSSSISLSSTPTLGGSTSSTTVVSSSTVVSQQRSSQSPSVPHIITIRTTTTIAVPASPPPLQKRQPTGPLPGNGNVGPVRPSHTTQSFDPEDPDETRIPASWTFKCCFEYAPLSTEKASSSTEFSRGTGRALPTAH